MRVDNRLLFYGVLLFFASLATGLLLVASPSFIANPRGVLSGHMEAAMNGMFVMIVALFFPRLTLSPTLARVCRGALLYGTYANWVFTTLSGVLGTVQSTPIAGAGHGASAGVEQFVLAGLVTVALSMVVAVALLLAGLRGEATSSAAA